MSVHGKEFKEYIITFFALPLAFILTVAFITIGYIDDLKEKKR